MTDELAGFLNVRFENRQKTSQLPTKHFNHLESRPDYPHNLTTFK